MNTPPDIVYLRGRWPEPTEPPDEPVWMYYEISQSADAVLRIVETFADGRVERNSIEIEQRYGDDCRSLIDGSLSELLACADGRLEWIAATDFDALWDRGIDTPLWFAVPPDQR